MRQPHAYRDLPKDELELLFSNYLLDGWSFSKVSSFARHEKAFEMSYIYRNPFKSAASAVAGEAYHEALCFYFTQLKNDGIRTDLVGLQTIAFKYIEAIEPHKWKVQKTTPSVEACITSATDVTVKLLKNFLEDISIYESELKEIIEVEYLSSEFLTINGVDIPLPCNFKIDLVIRTNDDKVVVIDHKSKGAYTDEKELKFSIGKQAITYAKAYEAGHNITVDEVWFVENKHSTNKSGDPQLNCFKMVLDTDTRRLYEAMLYEPLKRMLDAISNPDYIYLINESDNFVDKAEIYEFWAQTMMAEVTDFNIPENKAELIKKRLKKIRDTSLSVVDPKTIKKFRENASKFIQYDLTNKNMSKNEKIEHTLKVLGIRSNIAHKLEGYSSETFLLQVDPGTSIASIYKYRLDIANALNVSSVRMNKNLYVHEGKAYVSIEASKAREKDLMYEEQYLSGTRIPLGIDNFGKLVFWDVNNPVTPHMLIGGGTGSGKSVFIKSTIEYAILSGFKRIIILDPKLEFTSYKNITGIEVVSDISDIEAMMELLVEEMNNLTKSGAKTDTLVVFDELADAVDQSKKGVALNIYEQVVIGKFKNGSPKTERQLVGVKKSLQQNLKMLLQKGRSIGYRIMAATQRASVEVINGDTKVNFTIQVCFKVQKEVDSKVMIDEAGAESLIGNGDGLIKSPEYGCVTRFQSFFKP